MTYIGSYFPLLLVLTLGTTLSFVGKSDVEELEKALGQFVLYEDILRDIEPDRTLYLAIRQAIYRNVFEEPIGQVLLKNK